MIRAARVLNSSDADYQETRERACTVALAVSQAIVQRDIEEPWGNKLSEQVCQDVAAAATGLATTAEYLAEG